MCFWGSPDAFAHCLHCLLNQLVVIAPSELVSCSIPVVEHMRSVNYTMTQSQASCVKLGERPVAVSASDMSNFRQQEMQGSYSSVAAKQTDLHLSVSRKKKKKKKLQHPWQPTRLSNRL